MGPALFWSHALYKTKQQVAKSLLSYYIPSYIVMMAQLIFTKAIHYCLWATKKKEEQIVELQKFLGVSHLSLCSPKYTFLAKKLFPVYL